MQHCEKRLTDTKIGKRKMKGDKWKEKRKEELGEVKRMKHKENELK
jgi:hypothetical protein